MTNFIKSSFFKKSYFSKNHIFQKSKKLKKSKKLIYKIYLVNYLPDKNPDEKVKTIAAASLYTMISLQKINY
jgi:hypothetical protein